MGQCGCSDTNPMYQFPGPGDVTYGIQVYESCHYCGTPAGVELYRFGRDAASDWLGGVPQAPFQPYEFGPRVDGDLVIPILDPQHLRPALAEVCDPDDLDDAVDEVRMHLGEAVCATLDAWQSSREVAEPPFRHANGQPCHGCQTCLDGEHGPATEEERYCVDSGRPVRPIPGDRCLSHGAAAQPCTTAIRSPRCEHRRLSPNHPYPCCDECGKNLRAVRASPPDPGPQVMRVHWADTVVQEATEQLATLVHTLADAENRKVDAAAAGSPDGGVRIAGVHLSWMHLACLLDMVRGEDVDPDEIVAGLGLTGTWDAPGPADEETARGT